MDRYTIYEVVKGKSRLEVKYKRKGRDVIPFRMERQNFIVHLIGKNEFYAFNRFSGSRLRNYYHPEKPYEYRPDIKETGLLFRGLVEKDIISLAFLNKNKSDFADDFPEIMKASVDEHKRRFRHG